MKLSSEINELLVELESLESMDDSSLLDVNVGMLCQNLVEIYGKTTNPKTQDLIIKIIDKSGYSLFSSRVEGNNLIKAEEAVSSAISSSNEFYIDEEDFMELLPINGYFH